MHQFFSPTNNGGGNTCHLKRFSLVWCYIIFRWEGIVNIAEIQTQNNNMKAHFMLFSLLTIKNLHVVEYYSI